MLIFNVFLPLCAINRMLDFKISVKKKDIWVPDPTVDLVMM